MERRAGFSLIELVVVLVLVAVLAGGMTAFMVEPFRGWRDTTRRARLVDEAESALRRMARDVRRALPNSLRVAGGGSALELLHAADGARYRAQGGTNPGPIVHAAASDRLQLVPAGDASWNALGRFEALAFGYGIPLASGTRVAIHPTGSVVWADAASATSPGTITPAGTTITVLDDGDEDQLQLSAPFRFRFASPSQRMYLVDGPVSYLCDTAAGTLERFAGYAIAAAQPTDPGLAPLSAVGGARVANRVTACDFGYQPGTPTRTALLTLALSVSEAGETVRLLHQVHVENSP